MPVKVPTLDDRTYADLVREGVQLIPRHAPEWSNHNPSDPGITLLELFAYLAEIYLYRVDRIPEASRANMLKLLLGRRDVVGSSAALDHELRQAVVETRVPFTAVSSRDFEQLALEATRGGVEGVEIVRVHCFARRDLAAARAADRRRDRPGHVSLVFVPDAGALTDRQEQSVRTRIAEYLEPRRLLTCRVHVVAPRYVSAGIRIRMVPLAGHAAAAVEQNVRDSMTQFFDTRRGGLEQRGWPLGRSVYVSDLYRLLNRTEGVSRVVGVEVDMEDSSKVRRSETGEIVGVMLDPDEMFQVRTADVSSTSGERPR